MNDKVKQKIDDFHYQLREQTKRTDLHLDVIKIYAEAYYAIGILQLEVQETNELRTRVKELKEGFEGCCTACEPVAEMNKKLRDERDAARREIMNSIIDQACSNEEIEEEYRKRGWSYLKKENNND